MAQKKTYLYRMIMGHDGKTEIDVFMYARNSTIAIDYCKKLYKEKKYNYFKPIKVGVSLYTRNTGIVSNEDDTKLRNSIAAMGESYNERNAIVPQFISKEEAGDLIV